MRGRAAQSGTSILEAQLLGHAIESPVQAEAQGVGVFAKLGSNLHPGEALAAQVRELAQRSIFSGAVDAPSSLNAVAG